MASLADQFFEQLCQIPLIDPHSHINPLDASSQNLNDILGYHYYTELAHSAGLPKEQIESADGVELACRLAKQLEYCSNTVQVEWLVDLAQTFFGFEDDRVTSDNIESLFEKAGKVLSQSNWTDQVFEKTNLEAIFLTNDFDDPLEGFDTKRYIPCLRTDDLVFKCHSEQTRMRIAQCTQIEPTNWARWDAAIEKIFQHFIHHGVRACAISLPPNFQPTRHGETAIHRAYESMMAHQLTDSDKKILSHAIFYSIADRCDSYGLPFDLMIGVHRNVYPAGVHQGRDLYDKTSSLYQYRDLFNDFPNVVFPVSVLTHNQNQELVSYSWIFPNVVTSGHWWYSNTPAYIEADMAARMEAVPGNKQIGYYSDAYKLEFVLPKFNMYRRQLAKVLAERFVQARRWTEDRALEFGNMVLRSNVELIFPNRDDLHP